MKVFLKIPINHSLARIVRPEPVAHKHFHAAPRRRIGFSTLEFAPEAGQQLTQARFLNRQVQPDQRERRDFRAEHRRRAERPDHFVVAHVNDPHISLLPGAIAGDRQNYVRIDGRNAQIDDLKTGLGITPGQQGLQITRRGEWRLRFPARGGLAQNKNTIGACGLRRLHHKWTGPARQLRREKSQAETFVVDQKILAAHADGFKKIRGITVARQTQSRLDSTDQ